MSSGFYKYAKAYDIAFAGRDYKEECDFIEWCYKTHAVCNDKENSKPAFLELGCGPAHHAREFARRNWRSVALDLSKEMLEYAELVSGKEKLTLDYIEADMCEFNLERPINAAGIFTESITHLLTNEQFLSHLKSVAKNLLPGGIYVIETAHPLFFFPDDEPNIWEAEENGFKVKMLFGKPSDEYDPFLQQWSVTTRLEIKDNGNPKEIFESTSKHRWFLAQELRALIELSGVFDKYWIYGNMEIPPGPLDSSEDSDCMVVVLRVK